MTGAFDFKKIGAVVSIFLIMSTFSVSAVKVKNYNDDIEFSLTVEKGSLGWRITTTLEYTGSGWLYVEKDGYGDIGCIIYDKDDNEIWGTYVPEEGGTQAIGTGAKYESFTIWTENYLDGGSVPKGTYKIVGAAGYYDGDEYVPLVTDPYTVQVTIKSKHIFLENILSRFAHLKNIIFSF